DGNKSYAKLAAEMGCSKQTIANTINKACGRFRHCFEMVVTADEAILKNNIYICVPFI
ncbi:Hypothetical protein FKW44_008883, partial [Caligus rogercresseyi]